MKYYIKRLGSQELGSVRNGKAQRGRYIYISKDRRVLDMFPPLSTTVTNDSSILPIIPLYAKRKMKIYCNFVYHNDKFNVDEGTRDEYRIYSNASLEEGKLLFEKDDFLIFRVEKAATFFENISDDDPLGAVSDSNVYFMYLCKDRTSRLYNKCLELVENSDIRRGHAIFEGCLGEVEDEINGFSHDSLGQLNTVIDYTVTAKAQEGDIIEMANLFNADSFRDFVMTGYQNRCAITGMVIRYGSFLNLEAAHIWPKSHKGLYLPSNGIALCRDMHWAFDKGMFTVDDDYCVKVHPNVDSEYLRQFDKRKLFVPQNQFFRADINNLRYHQSNIYGLFKTAGTLVKAKGYYGARKDNLPFVAEAGPRFNV